MHLLFDLDGTLIDSREGVVHCFLYGLTEAGVEAPAIEALTQYVGPPLAESFAALIPNSDPRLVEVAIAAYRRRFEQVGIFENKLYPGMKDTLEKLSALGHSRCVVTAKPHKYARQILDRLEIAHLFKAVYGPELAQRQYSKESLIRKACNEQDLRPDETAMIGDRAEDILGAKENGLRSVGVTWGYGGQEELTKAQPDRLIASSHELLDYVRRRLVP